MKKKKSAKCVAARLTDFSLSVKCSQTENNTGKGKMQVGNHLL